jgi:hypothetical protein
MMELGDPTKNFGTIIRQKHLIMQFASSSLHETPRVIDLTSQWFADLGQDANSTHSMHGAGAVFVWTEIERLTHFSRIPHSRSQHRTHALSLSQVQGVKSEMLETDHGFLERALENFVSGVYIDLKRRAKHRSKS